MEPLPENYSRHFTTPLPSNIFLTRYATGPGAGSPVTPLPPPKSTGTVLTNLRTRGEFADSRGGRIVVSCKQRSFITLRTPITIAKYTRCAIISRGRPLCCSHGSGTGGGSASGSAQVDPARDSGRVHTSVVYASTVARP